MMLFYLNSYVQIASLRAALSGFAGSFYSYQLSIMNALYNFYFNLSFTAYSSGASALNARRFGNLASTNTFLALLYLSETAKKTFSCFFNFSSAAANRTFIKSGFLIISLAFAFFSIN